MSKSRIVLVEDDAVSARVIRFILDDEGFETVVASRGSQAFPEILGRETHLAILDVNLPDIDGFVLCRELRARRYNGPIIFLTARGDINDKLEGFRIGADDYLVKPFEPLELMARVQSVVRRFRSTDRQPLGTILRVGDAHLAIGELTYESGVTSKTVLTPTEMRLLECLMRNSNIVVSRDTLIERVWGYEFVGDDNRVDVYIRRLRCKIEQDPSHPRYLQTIRGLGYMFGASSASDWRMAGDPELQEKMPA